MDKTLYTLIVYSENIAGLLNQVTAVFTRRQINIESLNVSASSIDGVHKYTITAWTDEDTIKKVVKQIEKKIDVLQAHYFTDDEIFLQEIALYKISTPELQSNANVSKIIRRYNARIVEVNSVYSIVEKPGLTEEIIGRTWQAVEKYQACVAGMPVKDTIKEADGEQFVKKTLDRSRLWQIQTPQAFSCASSSAARVRSPGSHEASGAGQLRRPSLY